MCSELFGDCPMSLSESALSNGPSAVIAVGARKSPWRRTLLEACVLAVATCAVYSPALHGDFLLDDDKYLTENRLITGSNNLYRFWFSKSAG